jgi:hypothetical protein
VADEKQGLYGTMHGRAGTTGRFNRAADFLLPNSRATVDESGSEMSISKATSSVLWKHLTDSGVLFIRTGVHPAALKFTVESLLTLPRAHSVQERLR